MGQNPELEDRERLERFLEWRRADDESRKTARRHTAGMATLAVGVAALITAGGWYAINGHRGAVLTPTAKPDARVALATGVDTRSNPDHVPAAANPPVSRPESARADSDVASSAQVTRSEATPADAPSTPAESTPAVVAPVEPASSLVGPSADPSTAAPPAVTRPRAAGRLELPPRRRSARVLGEAGKVPAASTTPDVVASRVEPAPIATTPSPARPDVAVPRAPEPAPGPVAPAAAPPPAVVPDVSRATVPPANRESMRSEPSTAIATPPTTASPATRSEDAAAAAPRPTGPATASIRSDEPALAEPPTRLAPPAPPSTVEVLKEWTGYIPEVRLAKAIYRWAKKQPPPDGVGPEERQAPQSR